MSSLVTESTLEKKFLAVTNTQDSIQTLSLWLLHHKAHHKKIVETWLKVLKKDKISHRLTLFYLANDVIQNCKRKNVSFFKDSFAEVLKDATNLLKDDQIKSNIERVFRIWTERNVYESSFISELKVILDSSDDNSDLEESRIVAEYKVEKVISQIKLIMKSELEISNKTATINFLKLDTINAEVIQKFKDRKHGQNLTRDFDDNARSLEGVLKLIEKDIDERNELCTILEKSIIYYDNQKGEAKVVANAYKNFASRVKLMQKKITELLETFSSPVISPTSDAPSPTNSEAELKLPEEQNDKKSNVEQKEPPVTSVSQTTTTEVGNPIPTVSNIFNQEPVAMTSWLDTFAKKTESATISSLTTASISTSQTNSISLDSRLSSLLQNIPSLTSGLQGPIFSSNLSLNMSESIPNSPVTGDKGANNNSFQPTEMEVSTKEDQYSGQNTPLQDEDTPSSPSSFFTKLASAPKASQSPKEILKGLKNLIQNASSSMSNEKSFNLRNNSLGWSLDKKEIDEKPMIASTKKPLSHFTNISHNLSSSAIYQSPQQYSTTSANVNVKTSSVVSSSSQIPYSEVLSYSPKTISPETSISSNIHENLSFIPTLVPSTPAVTNFSFPSDDTYCPYSPTHENFETDMDIDSDCDENSPVPSDGTPDISDSKIEQQLNLPRQSALITLVTDNSPMLEKTNEISSLFPSSTRNLSESKRDSFSSMEGVPFSETNRILDSNSIPFCSDGYVSTVENIYSENMWPMPTQQQESILSSSVMDNVQKPIIPSTNCEDDESLNEAFFLTSPPTSLQNDFPNGQSTNDTDLRTLPVLSNVTTPLSKIETVDSHRIEAEEEQWWADNFDYANNRQQERKHFHQSRPYRRGDQFRSFDGPRQRFSHHNLRSPPYGSRPTMNFNRGRFRAPPPFPPRDGNWNRHPRPRY